MQNNQIQRRAATFEMTLQCTQETSKNVTETAQAWGQDVIVAARLTPCMPAWGVRALELTGTNLATPVVNKAAALIALIAAAGSYSLMTGTYSAASLRETLLKHVEDLLVAIDGMDPAAATAQWSTLKNNFATFKNAQLSERKWCLGEVAMPLYHAASIALKNKACDAPNIDFSDDNLVTVAGTSHQFISTRWPRTAEKLRAEVAA